MNQYSSLSESRLGSCHPDLQRLFREVLKNIDHTIVCGYRGERDQDDAFRQGKSKLQFPKSMHNKMPSLAVDVVPYPIDWNDSARFYYFAGYVKATAHSLGLKIRWGGDWDSDNDFKDQSFHDLPHFELVIS